MENIDLIWFSSTISIDFVEIVVDFKMLKEYGFKMGVEERDGDN